MSWLSMLLIAFFSIGIAGALVTLLTGYLFDKKKRRVSQDNKATLGNQGSH